MPRPRKRRHVCGLPERKLFGALDIPLSEDNMVLMSVEEYECIRLMDYEGLMQETCAEQMQVARTTVQRIYNDARKKLARALVEGKVIKIEGGDYKLCPQGKEQQCCNHCCRRIAAREANKNESKL
jgi:predicted DNA-binding protein (UPF0251 family)